MARVLNIYVEKPYLVHYILILTFGKKYTSCI